MSTDQVKIQSELTKFVRINTIHGLSLFLIDMAMFIIFIYGVILLPDIWMKLIASIGAGIKLSNLTTIAHDAAHNSLTNHRVLNKVIAIISLLPGLFNYRLWVYNHHQLHHPMTNLAFPDPIPRDAYTPYSKEEFDNLSTFDQWKERFYRSPSFFGFGIYFIIERWFKVMLFPRYHMPKKIITSSWLHFALVAFYFTGFLVFLSCSPLYSNTGPLVSILLGFFVPFFVSKCLTGFTLYVQHTHESVAWFNRSYGIHEKKPDSLRQEYVSVQVRFPEWFSILVHHVYDHGAHHVCPAIPCYKLAPAQDHLNKLMGERAVTQAFSFSWLLKTMKKCKLYDYENHCWLDFKGYPTTDAALASGEMKYARAA